MKIIRIRSQSFWFCITQGLSTTYCFCYVKISEYLSIAPYSLINAMIDIVCLKHTPTETSMLNHFCQNLIFLLRWSFHFQFAFKWFSGDQTSGWCTWSAHSTHHFDYSKHKWNLLFAFYVCICVYLNSIPLVCLSLIHTSDVMLPCPVISCTSISSIFFQNYNEHECPQYKCLYLIWQLTVQEIHSTECDMFFESVSSCHWL